MKWSNFLLLEQNKDYFQKLGNFLAIQERKYRIFPKKELIYACFNYFDVEETKVVIVGQDPYYLPNLANGLAFSVNPDSYLPKSLINIFSELKNDLGIKKLNGDLTSWAKQGVLLLNRVLTVNAYQPNSHRNQGWEIFTTNVIKYISQNCQHIVFVLWGKNAQELIPNIDLKKHFIIKSSHPSPLSYNYGFKNSKPFSKINEYLIRCGKKPIIW